MFFPTFVLGTINTVLSPVVKGCNQLMETSLLIAACAAAIVALMMALLSAVWWLVLCVAGATFVAIRYVYLKP